MDWKTGLLTIMLTISSISALIPAIGHADDHETLATAVVAADTVATNANNNPTTTDDAKAAGAGCLAGGALGSVVPVFGTLLGCTIGGVIGWLW